MAEERLASRTKKEEAPKDAKALVKIRVPRAEGETTMIVGDNGKYYKLKRGSEVEVPQSVADIIESSERNKEAAQQFIEALLDKSKDI